MRAINGAQRAMLEYLVEHGPAELPTLREAGLALTSVNPLVRRNLVALEPILIPGNIYTTRLTPTARGRRKVK